MDFDDVPEAEVAVAVAVTAVLASPRVRRLVRRGAIYGLAVLFRSADEMAGAARSLAGRIRPGMPMLGNGLEDITWAPTTDQATEVDRDG